MLSEEEKKECIEMATQIDSELIFAVDHMFIKTHKGNIVRVTKSDLQGRCKRQKEKERIKRALELRGERKRVDE